MPGENQTQTSTPENNSGNDIGNIMGDMSNNAQPETKPTDNGGEKGQGQSNADNGKGSEVQRPAWMSQIGDITKNEGAAEKLSKFAKLSDFANAYLELEGKLGNTLVKPGENASDEEREAFYKALGKPESADKYSIEGDDAKMFREMAYKNNLTDEQAKSFYSALKEVGDKAIAQHKENFIAQSKATAEALQAEYGKEYPTKIEMLKRGVQTYGGPAVGKKLQDAGLLGDLDVVKMFILLGEQSSEAGAQIKSEKASTYKSIENGGTLDFGETFKKK